MIIIIFIIIIIVVLLVFSDVKLILYKVKTVGSLN